MADDLLKFVLDAKSVGDLDFVVKSLDELNQAMGKVVKVTSTANDAGQLLSVNIHRQTEDYKNLVQVLKAHKDSGVLELRQTKENIDLLRQERDARRNARDIQRQYTADKRAYAEAVKAVNAAEAQTLRQQQQMLRFAQQQQAVGLLRARANQMPQTPLPIAGQGGGAGGGTPWWMPAGMGPGGGGAAAFLNTSSAFGMPIAGAGMAAAAAGAMMIKAANDAIPFHRQIAEIRTISQENQLATEDWIDGIFRLSNAFGRTKEEVAEGTYSLLSNQVAKGADTFKVLNSAMGLAQVTQASTADSVNALSSALNSYNISAEDSERVSAVFFKAVDLGRFRLSDVANNIGRVTFTSAQLGVSLEESLGALTVMTRRGLSSSEAMTLLHNMMVQLIKPSEEMKKTFREWGVETGQQAIAAFGFSGVLQKIGAAAHDNTTAMGKLFPEIRAMRGAFGLASDGGKELESDIKKLENSLRSYKTAQDEVFNAPGQQMERWKTEISNAIAQVGSNVLRFYEGMFRTIRNMVADGDKDPLLGIPDADRRREELRKRHAESGFFGAGTGDTGKFGSQSYSEWWDDFFYLVEEQAKRRERERYEEANKEGLANQRRQRQRQGELNATADAFEERARLFNEYGAKTMADQAKLDSAEADAMMSRRTDLRSAISAEIQNMSTTLREERADRLEAIREEQNRERELRKESRRQEVTALKDHHREIEEEVKRSREAREREFQGAGRNLDFNRDLFGIKKEALAFMTGGKATFEQEQALRDQFKRAAFTNAANAAGAGDLSSFRGSMGDLDKVLIDEINARKNRPQDRQLVMSLFNERIRLKQVELQVEMDIERRKQAEREGDRAREKAHKLEIIELEKKHRAEERVERQRELDEKKKERQEERNFQKFERGLTTELRKQEQALLGLDPTKFDSTEAGLGAFDTRAAAIFEKSEMLHPASARIIQGTLNSYREVFALELQKFHLQKQRTEALDQFNKLVKDGSEAMRKGGSADIDALEATRLKIVELNRELIVKNALLRGASPEDAARLRDSLAPAPSIANAVPSSAQRSKEAVDAFRAQNGISDNVSDADIRRARSRALRNGADAGFIPQTTSLRGSNGGGTTVAADSVQIGDINIVVPPAPSPAETGKKIGEEVRRATRRGFIRRR